MKQRTFCLVYQTGIANVFEVDRPNLSNVFEVGCPNLSKFGRNARRIMQGDFKTCESFANGLAYGNHIVHTFSCNQAGDISDCVWSEDLESQPFSDKFNPVFQRNVIL